MDSTVEGNNLALDYLGMIVVPLDVYLIDFFNLKLRVLNPYVGILLHQNQVLKENLKQLGL